MEKTKTNTKKTLDGIVVSDKMTKTIVVTVDTFKKHQKYQKYYKITKRYKARDEEGKYKVGDKVTIMETRPLSKDVHFIAQ